MALCRITATPAALLGAQLRLRAPAWGRDRRQRPAPGPSKLAIHPVDARRTDRSPEQPALQPTTTAPWWTTTQ